MADKLGVLFREVGKREHDGDTVHLTFQKESTRGGGAFLITVS